MQIIFLFVCQALCQSSIQGIYYRVVISCNKMTIASVISAGPEATRTGTWGGKMNMTWGRIMVNWNPWAWAEDCFGLLQPPVILSPNSDNSGDLQKKLVPFITILNFYLAYMSEKMKEGSWMGADGGVAWTTAPHLQGESVTTSVSCNSVPNQLSTWNTKNIAASPLPSKSHTEYLCGLH